MDVKIFTVRFVVRETKHSLIFAFYNVGTESSNTKDLVLKTALYSESCKTLILRVLTKFDYDNTNIVKVNFFLIFSLF